MKVSQIMSTEVSICSPKDTLQKAARMMDDIDAGALPVGENDRLVGIITDRDMVVRALAEGLSADTAVHEVMTDGIHYCFDDEALEDVAQQMADLQVRRLAVLNRDKRLVGVVSLGDITQAGREGRDDGGEALREISSPDGLHSQH
ncbi:MAG TPA: CBS domain-containing protein [Caulobacteraceae bacterium]|nr:CBS domain-containing protein [Caulobacteraceae bacterium]